MVALKAIVSDKDGVIRELVLKQRERGGAYTWYVEGIALLTTLAATPDDALRILRQEIAPVTGGSVQLISIARDEAGGLNRSLPG